MCVMLNKVGIVAFKHQGLLCEGNFARAVIHWLGLVMNE